MKITLDFKPPIIAHRGACSHAPENTLAAFRKAKELGLNWVEFDVMLCADGEAVVIHDETLHRTTSGRGLVADLCFKDLSSLDAGSWFNPSFKNERISSLTEVIQLLNSIKMQANIEIKAQKGLESATVKKVITIISKYWDQTTLPLISSFSYEILNEVRLLSKEALIGVLMHQWQPKWKEIADHLNAISVDVNHLILNASRVNEIKETNRALLAYTVNDLGRARLLWGWGVDAIFSDCPDEMLASSTDPYK